MSDSKRPVRMAVLLPIVLVAISGVLTVWADKVSWIRMGGGSRPFPRHIHLHLFVIDLRTILLGINAPTFPFNVGGLKPVFEPLYLILVGLLWYFVGRLIDERRGPQFAATPLSRNKREILATLSFLWGTVLIFLCGGLLWEAYSSGYPWVKITTYPVNTFTYSLHFVWGVFLVVVGVTKYKRGSAETPCKGA